MVCDSGWVDDLSPAQLYHYADLLARVRAEHLREALNVQVSAAAVIADGGDAAKKIDAALAAASGAGIQKARRRDMGEDDVPIAEFAKRSITADEAARTAKAFANPDAVFKRR